MPSEFTWTSIPVSEDDYQTAIELCKIANNCSIMLDENILYHAKFVELIEQLRKNHPDNNRVVILIDEYDAPIIDNLQNVDEVHKIRWVMKAFYSVIKAMDADIQSTEINSRGISNSHSREKMAILSRTFCSKISLYPW